MENSRVKVVEIGKTVDFQGEGVNTKKGKFQGGGHDKIAWKSRVSASKRLYPLHGVLTFVFLKKPKIFATVKFMQTNKKLNCFVFIFFKVLSSTNSRKFALRMLVKQ